MDSAVVIWRMTAAQVALARRAIAFAAFWRQCELLGDSDVKAFRYWSLNVACRNRWRRESFLTWRENILLGPQQE